MILNQMVGGTQQQNCLGVDFVHAKGGDGRRWAGVTADRFKDELCVFCADAPQLLGDDEAVLLVGEDVQGLEQARCRQSPRGLLKQGLLAMQRQKLLWVGFT